MAFHDKIVAITGAGSGVGRGLAAGFCADGAHVVGFGRTREDLEQTAERHGQGRMHWVVGDLARAEDVTRLFDDIRERHGRVDILINNAASYPKDSFLDSSMAEWAKVVEVNVIGTARCCHAVLPGMLERGYGRILNVGTLAWRGPIPNSSAYCASKAAIAPLTKAIASEIDRDRYPDVLINEFLPGVVRTRMSDTGEDPMQVYQHAKAVALLPRGGPTGQTFLLSELYEENQGIRARLGRLVKKGLEKARL